MFDDQRLAFKVCHRIVNVRAIGAANEECGSGTQSHVLNMNMMLMMLAEALKQFIGSLGGIQRLDQFHSAAGEVIFLNVNEEQSNVHKNPVKKIVTQL